MNWLKALASSALAMDACQVVKLGEREILLVKHGGEVFAVQSSCPHMGGHLKDGRITPDGHIVCPLHHSEFDLRTGEIIAWAPWPPGVGAAAGRHPGEEEATSLPDQGRRTAPSGWGWNSGRPRRVR